MTRRNRRILIPEAQSALDYFKGKVMAKEGYKVDQEHPNDVKYEVAEGLGIPLKESDNGKLTTEQAGKIGGAIGGNMVREMIKLAEQKIIKK
jgi:hypothetical protein